MAQRMESKLAVFSALLDVRELAYPVLPHTSPFRHSAHSHEHLLCPTQDVPTQVSSMANGLPSGTLIALRHTPIIAQFRACKLINVPKEEWRVLAEPVLEKLIWEAPKFLGASGI